VRALEVGRLGLLRLLEVSILFGTGSLCGALCVWRFLKFEHKEPIDAVNW